MDIKRSYHIILPLCLLITGSFCHQLLAQEQIYTIRVVDKLSEKPVREASILLQDSTQTTTNYMGYFQLNGTKGDSIFIDHNQYETTVLVLPDIKGFQVALKIENEFLDFEGGIVELYKYLQANLKYPRQARSRGEQARIYVILKVDSSGVGRVASINNDEKSLFYEHLEEVFEGIPGKWSPDYSGKTILIPIEFNLSSHPDTGDGQWVNFDTDIELSEISVTAYAEVR